MRIENDTPFAAMTFDHWDAESREFSILIVKAMFKRRGTGWSSDGVESALCFEDSYDGDPARSPLLSEQDIAPEKPATDLVLQATAYAPHGAARPDWPVGVSIPGRLDYAFHVRGPTFWQKSWLRGWHQPPPLAVTEVRLDYRLAFGGAVAASGGSEHVHEANPAGIGLADPERMHDESRFPAPQIGTLAEFEAQDITTPMQVQGFGPIARAWTPRRQMAGTYDQNWQTNRHPRLPLDFDPRFWNFAPLPLQITPYLTGDEEIHLRNLHPTRPTDRLRLPAIRPLARLAPAGQTIDLALDTVALDLRGSEDAHSLTLIWRGRFPASELHQALRIEMMDIDQDRIGGIRHGQKRSAP